MEDADRAFEVCRYMRRIKTGHVQGRKIAKQSGYEDY